MNKYLLVISAIAAFGGVSNMFSGESSYKKDSAELFMDDLRDRHNGKMTLASGIAIADFICRPLIVASCLSKTQKLRASRVGAPLWLAAGLMTYSVGETLAYRSKKQ